VKKLVFFINFILILSNASGMYSENYVKRDHERSFSTLAEVSEEGSVSKKMRDDSNSGMSIDSFENFSRKRSYSEMADVLSENLQSEKGKEIIEENNNESGQDAYQDMFLIITKLRQQIEKLSFINKEDLRYFLDKIEQKRQKKDSRIEELKNQNLFLRARIAELTRQIEEFKLERLRTRNFKKPTKINGLYPRNRELNKQKEKLSDLYIKNHDALAYYRAYSPLKKLVIKAEDLMNIPVEILEFPKLKEIIILGDLGHSQKAQNRLSDLISKAYYLEVLKFR